MSVDIHKIRIDGGTQSRAAINEATVAEYAEAMADPDTVFPPVIVYFDGREYWLADGFHRLAAWAKIGRTDIPAEIRQGDRRRAILHSVAANSAHGLRRTNDDKRRAVMVLLEDEEWSAWSNREIARRCAVSDHLVADVRAGLTAYSRSEDGRDPRTYTTKHGTPATMNTGNIGAKAAEKPEQISTEFVPEPVGNTAQEPAETPETSAPPEEDPAIAKARRELAKLTREGLEDEVIGLRAALADERARRKAITAERDDLKAKLRDLTADDKDEVIRRLQAQVKHAQGERFRAEEKFAAEKRKTYALGKRVGELEHMEIPLN